MPDIQPQTNQKTDQPSKPVIADNNKTAAKPADTTMAKPVKSGNV